ncbi:glycoside hydrolase family 92 protein [Hypoxylon sp. FL1150]|nr:glycoside hydrolase family 92 protein [Hypoxylon sp. FL1150]
MQPRVGEDVAQVGYYKTQLQNGVTAEMSASMHAGIMQYTYPKEADGRFVLSNGKLERSDDGTSYTGYGVYREGGDFRIEGGTMGYQYADRIGALFEFPSNATTVKSKVGISWVSTDKACQFLDEIPHWDLEEVRDAAKDKWNSDVLSTIDITTTNETQLEMFYTAMYHSHLLPSNRTSKNPYWEFSEPYYDDFYTIWDTFRCLHPLLTLIQPKAQREIVRAMIDIWRFERFMPEGRSHNFNGRVQGGSNSDNVLADAYVKGLQGDVNWTDGYAAMKTNAEVQPYNNFDFEGPTGSTKEGRGALQDWKQYGYVTPSNGRCLSKTVEYSLNDFSLFQVAQGEKTWAPDVTSPNFTGFLAPTYPNGSYQDYDPLSCGACEWSSISYEGVPWEYSWTIPFDMEMLISLMGGPEKAEARLDTMFITELTASDQGGNSAGSTIFNPGNEPSFMTPFVYNYFPQRQHKSVQRSREVVDEYYNTGRSGIPGNDDAGAMSSWLVWNMIGLYPVVTQPVYLVLAPRFEDVAIRLEDGGARLKIKASCLEEGSYVQNLKVNGQGWNKSWIRHEDIIRPDGQDSLLEFKLGAERVKWDIGDVPPSPGHVQL